MSVIRSIPVDRIYDGKIVKASERAVVSDPNFRTHGEEFIVIKNIDSCKVVLDSSSTDHIKIKALTKVLIIPSIGRIDEEWDEILIDKGACVEFAYMSGNWYIMSSDGLKLD
jgi:hypothetical protein